MTLITIIPARSTTSFIGRCCTSSTSYPEILIQRITTIPIKTVSRSAPFSNVTAHIKQPIGIWLFQAYIMYDFVRITSIPCNCIYVLGAAIDSGMFAFFVTPLAAYSHSFSDGSRKYLRVIMFNLLQNRKHSLYETLVTGRFLPLKSEGLYLINSPHNSCVTGASMI